MNPTKAMTDFLDKVGHDYGAKLRESCEEVFASLQLKEGEPFNPLHVLAQAKLRLQQPLLQDLAAVNAMPFASARNRDG